MARANDIDAAASYDKRITSRPVGETYAVDEIYIQYESDMVRLSQQKEDTLEVLRFYRKTELVPTKRRIIKTDKELQFLIDILGLGDNARTD